MKIVCDLKMITRVDLYDNLLGLLYARSGVKWSITFCGSKGYWSHVEFSFEGNNESGKNRIGKQEIFCNSGAVRKGKQLNIFWNGSEVLVEVVKRGGVDV